MTIVPDARRVVAGYLYEIEGQYIPLDAIEVAHFRRWHPNNDFYGLSPITAARGAILSDRHMADWNRQTFGQDKGVFRPASSISATSSPTLISSGSSANGAATMAGRRARPLSCAAAPWSGRISGSATPISISCRGGRRSATRSSISSAFPVGLVSENATEANAKSRRAPIHRAHALSQTRAHRSEDQPGAAALLRREPGRRIRGHPPDRCARRGWGRFARPTRC